MNYITLEQKEQEHRAIADNVTSIIRDIIKFQTTYVDEIVDELDDIAVAEGKQVEIREGSSQAGVDNLSEIWSETLSRWPSETDSEVKK